ncbi:MAG: hypothetical protein QME96_17285 [Myxococcota bacterium]|nr:hypothetical protein [Myxococcota bacterium]
MDEVKARRREFELLVRQGSERLGSAIEGRAAPVAGLRETLVHVIRLLDRTQLAVRSLVAGLPPSLPA